MITTQSRKDAKERFLCRTNGGGRGAAGSFWIWVFFWYQLYSLYLNSVYSYLYIMYTRKVLIVDNCFTKKLDPRFFSEKQQITLPTLPIINCQSVNTSWCSLPNSFCFVTLIHSVEWNTVCGQCNKWFKHSHPSYRDRVQLTGLLVLFYWLTILQREAATDWTTGAPILSD